MDLFTFIATLVGHLAWPSATILLVLFAVIRLPKIVKYVKTFRYKDLELTIREEFDEARQEAEQVTLEQAAPTAEEPPTDKLMELFAVDPSIAIIMVWKRLEQKLVEFMQHNGLVRHTTPTRLIQHLARIGKLSRSEMELFEKLRRIRNASVHSRDEYPLSKAEVVEYNEFVELLIHRLDELMRQPGYVDIPSANSGGSA